MAGDWLKWTKGLAKKREVAFLASKLGRGRHEIAGRLMELWEWCDDNFTDANLVGYELDVSLVIGDNPLDFVDSLCGLQGMAKILASPEVDWLRPLDGGLLLFPHLARHNGTSAKTRATESQKKRRQRQRTRCAPGDENAVGKCPQNSGTREERREEISSPDKPKGSEVRKETDPLFDTVASLSAVDPSLHGARIGRTVKALRQADPPYTPEEVSRLPEAIRAAGWSGFALNPESILKHIALVRARPSGEKDAARIDREMEARRAGKRS